MDLASASPSIRNPEADPADQGQADQQEIAELVDAATETLPEGAVRAPLLSAPVGESWPEQQGDDGDISRVSAAAV